MLIDARRQSPDWQASYDVCIIGAGASGIAMALEFINTPAASVLVLEAGGFDYDTAVQDLYEGQMEGDRHAPVVRGRYAGLGGATKVWSGWCRPLDPHDFQQKDWLPLSGWPLTAADLEPYYARASLVCGLDPSHFTLADWHHAFRGKPLLATNDIVHPIFQIRRMDFAASYAQTLAEASNITVVLHAPVLRLQPRHASDYAVSVQVARPDGTTCTLSPKLTVLAAGGLENPRLLLLSGESPHRAIGNQHDLVGRYFTEHGFADPGWFVPDQPSRDMQFYFPKTDGADRQVAVRPVLSLAPDVLARQQLLNAGLYFYPAYEAHEIFTHPAVRAALEFWDIVKHQAVPTGRWQLLWQALRSPRRLLHAVLRKRFVRSPQRRWRLRMYYECVPACDNRVLLTEQKDAYGRPRLKLKWRLQETDLLSADRFCRHLDNLIRQHGKGRLQLPDEPEQWRAITEAGKHPMGATRMATDPARGVVDRNCQVHGFNNLYVAGSSVFPTAGYANPTLTLVALAIRLADHLKERLRPASIGA